MVNVSSFLWTSAGQKADGMTPTHTHTPTHPHPHPHPHPHTHTHTRGGRQPCHLVPCHPSRLAPEEFRAITQQVGLPVGVLTVGAMTVGSMGRPH